MTAIVPDTMQGALIVSVIDFFLSFLIISGIGFILSLFPLLNRAARLIASCRPAIASVDIEPVRGRTTDREVPAEDIAALTAAVFVIMDGAAHRIINIQPSQRRGAWVMEGRIAQHGTHTRAR